MDTETLAVIAEINRAVIKFRGVYSVWSKKHGISYNEMLVLYSGRIKNVQVKAFAKSAYVI